MTNPSPRTWFRRGFSVATITLVTVALTGFAVVTRPDQTPRETGPGVEPLVVEAQAIIWQSGYSVPRFFVGRVEARQESDLGFEIPGMIASIAVEEGQIVPAGGVLATLDADRLRARRTELIAARDQAEAESELANLRLQRVTDTRDRGAASVQEWDDADRAAAAARANLSRAEAAVASVDVDLEKTALRAPFDAVVADRYVDTGRVLDAGTPVLRLLERPRPEVRIGVGGSAVDSVEVGARFAVSVRDRVVDGVVTGILPTRNRTGRDVDVIISLDAELDGVRSGDLARVSIERSVRERGFWVPAAALTEGARGLWAIYIIQPDPNAAVLVLRRADVEVIHQTTDRAYVRGPIDEGVHFVPSGLHRIAPGMTIRTVDAPEHDA